MSEPESVTSALRDSGLPRVAIVGRPNVGKSTLVNRMLGEERVIVYDQAGTTRDSIYIPFERDDEKYTLIDTAGGKALLAAMPDLERETHLRRARAAAPEKVNEFLNQFAAIRRTGIATNARHGGARFAIATTVRSSSGGLPASLTLVGAAELMEPRIEEFSALLAARAAELQARTAPAREAI